ncbi:MAG: AMP-binding protein, partial [Stackebrandtia sp.]
MSSLRRVSPLQHASRLLSRGWHIGYTMARRGLLVPGRPDRVARQLSTLAQWGLSLAGGFGSAARRSPDAAAVIDEDGSLSFAELDERTDRLARALREFHPGAVPRIGLLCRNHRGMVETLVACAKTGSDVVLINTGMSAAQIRQALSDNDIDIFVADAEFLPLPSTPESVRTITADRSGAGSLSGLIESATPGAHRPPSGTGRTIVLTSGTTGAPKGARRPAPALHSLTALLSRIPLKVGDRIHIAAPLFHTWGYAALQLAMAMRGTVVLRRRFEPEALLRGLAADGTAVVFAVPVMLQRLLELPESVRR